jgi:hypothetical protein
MPDLKRWHIVMAASIVAAILLAAVAYLCWLKTLIFSASCLSREERFCVLRG